LSELFLKELEKSVFIGWFNTNRLMSHFFLSSVIALAHN